jgi:hypothetical protein
LIRELVALNAKLFPGTPQTKKALSMSMSEMKVAMSASAEYEPISGSKRTDSCHLNEIFFDTL